ncbi:MAG: FecR domain-containing protein [Bacteroidota bacterium]
MKYNTDQFLRKLATDDVSVEEHEAFKNWLMHLPLRQQKQILDRFEIIYSQTNQNNIFKSLPLPNLKRKNSQKLKRYYGIAAAISIVLLSAFTILSVLQSPEQIEYHTSSEGKTMKLEDGTQVELMPNSSLTVSFTKNSRQIELAGEALFQVVRDEDRPMRVTTEGVTTTVLGTTFRIKQMAKGLLVNLIEGSISVSHQEVETKIAPSQQWYLNRSTGKSFTFNAKNKDFKEVRFENEPLEKIIAYLEMRYNLDSSPDFSELKKCQISITIGDMPLSTCLELIEFATALSFKRSGNRLEVFGTCN